MHISIDLDQLPEEELRKVYLSLKLIFEPKERAQILSMDLSDIRILRDLDTRVCHLLKSRGIYTLQALAATNRETLERINGMGPKYLRHVERLLRKYGLELSRQ
jgi:DNA-directed RNA polymerase alpha subunit